MTDDERRRLTVNAVTAAITAYRAGETAECSGGLAHAVHIGCTPADILAEIVNQTGGTLNRPETR